MAAYQHANGDDYCRVWAPVNHLALAPALVAFAASAGLSFGRGRALVMLVVALAGPGYSLACAVGHG